MRILLAVSVLLCVGMPVRARESMVVDVVSSRSDLDEVVRRRFVEKLSPRFDIVDRGGTYLLHVIGTDIYEEHRLVQGKSASLDAVSFDRMEYTIALELPDRSTKLFRSSFEVEEDGSAGTLAGVFWTFNHWINKCIPIAGAVSAVDPEYAHLDVGKNADVRIGDWFDVFDRSGRLSASLEVEELSDSTALARRLDDHLIEPGFRVRQRARLLSWGMGVEYAHMRIPAGVSSKAGHEIMFTVPWRPRFLKPVALRFASGYLDVVSERGWHVLSVEAMLRRPLRGRTIDLEYGAGLGGAMLRITGRVGPRTGSRIKEIGVFTAKVYTGVAIHLDRYQTITAGIGYIGYSHCPRPEAPSLEIGYRCWAF